MATLAFIVLARGGGASKRQKVPPEERKTRREPLTGHTPATCLKVTPGVCAQLILACGQADGP